ncbi:hypothetical protein EON66_00655, partial [archaeon]
MCVALRCRYMIDALSSLDAPAGLVMILEGGYNLVSIAADAVECVHALHDAAARSARRASRRSPACGGADEAATLPLVTPARYAPPTVRPSTAIHAGCMQALREVCAAQAPYWRCMATLAASRVLEAARLPAAFEASHPERMCREPVQTARACVLVPTPLRLQMEAFMSELAAFKWTSDKHKLALTVDKLRQWTTAASPAGTPTLADLLPCLDLSTCHPVLRAAAEAIVAPATATSEPCPSVATTASPPARHATAEQLSAPGVALTLAASVATMRVDDVGGAHCDGVSVADMLAGGTLAHAAAPQDARTGSAQLPRLTAWWKNVAGHELLVTRRRATTAAPVSIGVSVLAEEDKLLSHWQLTGAARPAQLDALGLDGATLVAAFQAVHFVQRAQPDDAALDEVPCLLVIANQCPVLGDAKVLTFLTLDEAPRSYVAHDARWQSTPWPCLPPASVPCPAIALQLHNARAVHKVFKQGGVAHG